MSPDEGKRDLDKAFAGLEDEVPDRVCRTIRWLRDPRSKRIRLTVGITLIVLSFAAILPVIGIELLPLGLLLIAEDVPLIRKPVARFMIWLENKWVALKERWRKRHAKGQGGRRAGGGP
jgi:hypothetical protein